MVIWLSSHCNAWEGHRRQAGGVIFVLKVTIASETAADCFLSAAGFCRSGACFGEPSARNVYVLHLLQAHRVPLKQRLRVQQQRLVKVGISELASAAVRQIVVGY